MAGDVGHDESFGRECMYGRIDAGERQRCGNHAAHKFVGMMEDFKAGEGAERKESIYTCCLPEHRKWARKHFVKGVPVRHFVPKKGKSK